MDARHAEEMVRLLRHLLANPTEDIRLVRVTLVRADGNLAEVLDVGDAPRPAPAPLSPGGPSGAVSVS
jgi:hypothetical protein